MDDDYTARAPKSQPAPAGCGVVAHRRLAGVDDPYTAAAAILQPAPAGCGVAVHRRLAGVDDDYTARAAIRQPVLAGCGVVAHRRLAGVDDLYTARAATGSRLRPAAAWWFTGLSHQAADLLLAVGLELVRHLPSRKLYCIRATAWQPALAGCWPLRLHYCDASGYPPGCPPSPPYSPLGSPSPALLGPLTHICGLDNTPRVEGGPAPSWRGLLMGSLRRAWRN